MSLESIRGYVEVNPELTTAGQPSEAQLAEIADRGYRTVINLGLMDKRYCLPDEAGLAHQLGMSYHHIPVEFTQPRQSDIARFFDVMDASLPERTFVHCAANYRVSCFVGLYGRSRWGWSTERAQDLMARIWTPDEVWQRLIQAWELEQEHALQGATP
jgi:protein tyrosine phosphatase (PTP) superfamily phosphohydrolase (DUF442 family)